MFWSAAKIIKICPCPDIYGPNCRYIDRKTSLSDFMPQNSKYFSCSDMATLFNLEKGELLVHVYVYGVFKYTNWAISLLANRSITLWLFIHVMHVKADLQGVTESLHESCGQSTSIYPKHMAVQHFQTVLKRSETAHSYINRHIIGMHIYIYIYIYIQPQIRKSWDSMENANKKRK